MNTYTVIFLKGGSQGYSIIKRLKFSFKNEALHHVRGKKEVQKIGGKTWLVVGTP